MGFKGRECEGRIEINQAKGRGKKRLNYNKFRKFLENHEETFI